MRQRHKVVRKLKQEKESLICKKKLLLTENLFQKFGVPEHLKVEISRIENEIAIKDTLHTQATANLAVFTTKLRGIDDHLEGEVMGKSFWPR